MAADGGSGDHRACVVGQNGGQGQQLAWGMQCQAQGEDLNFLLSYFKILTVCHTLAFLGVCVMLQIY